MLTTDKTIGTSIEAEVRRLEAEHVQRTGKKLDSVALSIIRPVVENSIRQQDQFKRALDQLTEATAKISTTQRPFHSDDRWAAFLHGVGKTGLAGIILAILAVVAYTHSVAYQNYVSTVGSLPDYELYSDLIKSAHLIKTDAGVYISLPPGKNESGRVGCYYNLNCQPPGKKAAPVLIPLRYN